MSENQQIIRPLRLNLPKRAVRRLEEVVGIYCRSDVRLEYQQLGKRYVVHATESGGAIREIGRYVTFCGAEGEPLEQLHPVDSLGVNGVHAVVVAPVLVKVDMFRFGRTYQLLISKHQPSDVSNGKRPSLESTELFRGVDGFLALALESTGKDNDKSEIALPVFYSHNYGPLEIRATNGALLAAISQVSGLNRSTSGFFRAQSSDSSEQNLILPYVVENESFRTNLGLNNLGNRLASVNVELFGADGKPVASHAPVQIAPQGLLQINRIVSYLSVNSPSSPSTQGYLRITSDQPILAFASQIDNASNDPSISTGVSTGSRSLLLQASANTNFRSSLFVVNPNDSAVDVTLIAREGNTTNNGAVTATKTQQVPPNGQVAIENLLQELGASSSFGPVEIRCALPVIAVSRVYNPTGNTSGFLEAQAVP